MKFLLMFVLLASMVALSLHFSRQSARSIETIDFTTFAAPSIAEGSSKPIVIELFTSEGCSSCPPADALLQQLEQSSPVAGAELIVLSEHVDYWNYIGWADPFSAPLYSARQQGYAHALQQRSGRGDVYTPQMIVDGQFEFVGSNVGQARAAIAKALASPKAAVNLALLDVSSPTQLKFHLQINDLPPRPSLEQAEVLLVVTESKLTSSVTRGENAGHKLPHAAVTRSLQVITQVPAAQNSFEATANLTLAEGWKHPNLCVIALVQEHTSRRILGATSYKLN